MIFGIGVDMTRISRMERIVTRFPERFARRILAPQEWDDWCRSAAPVAFLAKRFAVKEAAMKALGTGAREGVWFKDFYLQKDALNKPLLRVQGVAAERCRAASVDGLHASISDEGDHVVAFVVLERSSVHPSREENL